MKRSLSCLLIIILCLTMLPIQVFAVSNNDLYTQYPYYLGNEEYDKIEKNTSIICQKIVDSQKGFHEFEAIVATLVDDGKSIATSQIGAFLGLNSSYDESIRENAVRKLISAISAENMSENEFQKKVSSEAKKWMGVYRNVTEPFQKSDELSNFLKEFLTGLGIDTKYVSPLNELLIKDIPNLFKTGSQGITAYQTVLSITATYGYRMDSVRVLMDSVDKNSDLYKDLQYTLDQMKDPVAYINTHYTSKQILEAIQKWFKKGVLDEVIKNSKQNKPLKNSETLDNASWVLSLCKSLYFTFIYEGYKVNDYAEAVYLLGYETDINTARTKLLINFYNGAASTEDIDRYQKLFDLEIIAQIAALQAFAGLLSVYNRYDLKMEAEDQAALLSWNHDYNWYIKQCIKCLEADLSAGKAVKGTSGNQAKPSSSNTVTVASNVAKTTSTQNSIGANAVSEASALIGKYPYKLGGKSPSDGGFDCTGLIYYVYHNRLGCNVTYDQIWRRGVPGTKITEKSNLLPGDIVFGLTGPNSWHTGLYCGNNTMIHSGSSKGVCKTSINGTWFDFQFATRPSFLQQGATQESNPTPPTPTPPTQNTTPCTTHTKGSLVKTANEHPHYNYYKCRNCGAEFTDGSTSNLSSCTQCNPPAYVVKYVNCYTHINCPSRTVNLYLNPTDSTRYDYFSQGQIANSSTYAVMSDGSTWYQVRVLSNGNSVDLWMKGESDITFTKRHTFGEIKYETAHPHKGYQECECGQKAYTATETTVSSCQVCLDQKQSSAESVVNRIPAESLTITNGRRYLYVYKPTGEIIAQTGDEYEIHMTPNSTYQLNTVITPSNTTDPIEYSVRFVNNNPSNGAGVSVSSTGLIAANETAHGSVIVHVTCGNCWADIHIIMCNSAGERL